jgi:hypothetical protein
MDKFFSIRKFGSMDEHLIDMKEVANLLDDVELPHPKKILVFYNLKNIPKEHDVIKQIIFNENKLPTYLELALRLLNDETSKKMDGSSEKESEALLTFAFGGRCPFG